MEDKILFEQAYSSHGKSFKRIQQIVSKCATYMYSTVNSGLLSRQLARLPAVVRYRVPDTF